MPSTLKDKSKTHPEKLPQSLALKVLLDAPGKVKPGTRLIRAGEILGIQIVDHVIIGDNCYYSFRERRPDLFGSSSQRDACLEEKNCSRSLSPLNI
jgi:RadC-like JAB domain